MTAMKEQPSARQIYGTIGPACADVETLEAMFRAGMTGIRLNLSHVTLAQAADQVDALHKAAQRKGPLSILRQCRRSRLTTGAGKGGRAENL